jgi:hypothetical protein
MEEKKLKYFSGYSTHKEENIRNAVNNIVDGSNKIHGNVDFIDVWILVIKGCNLIFERNVKNDLVSALIAHSKIIIELISLFPEEKFKEFQKTTTNYGTKRIKIFQQVFYSRK